MRGQFHEDFLCTSLGAIEDHATSPRLFRTLPLVLSRPLLCSPLAYKLPLHSVNTSYHYRYYRAVFSTNQISSVIFSRNHIQNAELSHSFLQEGNDLPLLCSFRASDKKMLRVWCCSSLVLRVFGVASSTSLFVFGVNFSLIAVIHFVSQTDFRIFFPQLSAELMGTNLGREGHFSKIFRPYELFLKNL